MNKRKQDDAFEQPPTKYAKVETNFVHIGELFMQHIFLYLNGGNACQLRRVCSTWNQWFLQSDMEEFWKQQGTKKFTNYYSK